MILNQHNGKHIPTVILVFSSWIIALAWSLPFLFAEAPAMGEANILGLSVVFRF